ncbi:hypothetical protein DFH11DRAFT_1726131 [Phellopilus nigrolimitatus]|nr:hypothetical protein DFH11DRAFT_1726131 [Phellopilus nigrolimitatus]
MSMTCQVLRLNLSFTSLYNADTPGIFDHPLEDMNTIEMQSITALAHLKACCGYPIQVQCSLFHSIKPLFGEKPVLLVLNKTDVCRLEDLALESRTLIDEIIQAEGVQVSCYSEEGVMDVKNMACDALLAHRVDTKLKGSKINTVINHIHVAQPKPRDDVERKPFVPDAVLTKKKLDKNDPDRRKLERDTEGAEGGAGVYNIGLQKNYLPEKDEWKLDTIPETLSIWASRRSLSVKRSGSPRRVSTTAIRTWNWTRRTSVMRSNRRMRQLTKKAMKSHVRLPRTAGLRTLTELTDGLTKAGLDPSRIQERAEILPKVQSAKRKRGEDAYNANFDERETRAELSQIAWVPRQINSPQANKPVMGIMQDTLCGVRKFTLRDSFLDWTQVQNILLWVPNWDGSIPTPAILKPKPLWTGKQILSMTILRGINIFRSPEPKSSNPVFDDGMLIENGEIIFGIVEKKTVGASQGGLIHVVFREKGPEATRTLFTGLQQIVNYWLFHNGFSIGIGDTVADKKTMAYITEQIKMRKANVTQAIEDAHSVRLKAAPVEREPNLACDHSGQYAQKNLKEDNNVKQMVVAGSKVGQQSVEGKRIPFGFRHRTLPHFTKDDFSPEVRGFVENS